MTYKAKYKRIYDPALGRLVAANPDDEEVPIVDCALETARPIHQPLAQMNLTSYHELLNALYDATLITDINGTIIEANMRVEYLLGFRIDELPGMSVTELITGSGHELITKVQQHVQNRTFIQVDCTCAKKSGERFPAVIVANALGTGSEPRLCFFIRNAKAKRQIERELRAAAEMVIEAEKIQARIDTVSTLLHSINNPLQIISCLAELDTNPEYKKQIDVIIATLEQLSQRNLLEETIDEEGQSRYVVDIPRELMKSDKDRLLVVDDEKVLREMFVMALQNQFPDKTIDQAADGLSAVSLFSTHQHGLILMDAQMPELNGEEAFLQIRKICQSRGMEEPSCVFCTGFQISDQIAEIVGDGSRHAFLKKPLRFSVLAETIDKVMQNEADAKITEP